MTAPLVVAALLLAACDSAQEPAPTRPAAKEEQEPAVPAQRAPFDFDRPASVVPLPKSLRELSGMVALDAERIACVQDEKGLLYEVRLADGEILARTRFAEDGDYEGVARVGDSWYVARSDAVLLRCREKDGALQPAVAVELALPQADCEALCAEPDGSRLLVAGKSRPEGDKAERDRRYVHAFEVKEQRLVETPILDLSVKELLAKALERGWRVPMRAAKPRKNKPDAEGEAPPPERPFLLLHTSELAVDPRTGNLAILSGPDRVLVLVDRAGAPQWLQTLDAALLPQPEALAFLPGGDLLVASEGVDGPAVLVRFSRAAEVR